MEFRILGPLYADAGTGNGPVVIRQPLLQSALAVLLLHANRTCPRNFLIEALWGTEPPAAPEAALRVCISRLRQCLGDCSARLCTVGPPGGRAPIYRQQRGYFISVRPGELDVDEFTDLAAQGQAELDLGNATAAATTFVQALSLWGDPPLPDIPESPVLAGDVTRLVSQRQTVMDALIDARLDAGEHDQVLGQLRAAAAADPGRERTSEQLMRACHELGLSKEALDVYQAARRAALEEQGTEPGPALGVLYRRILAEEQTADRFLARPARLAAARLAAARPHLPGAQAPSPPGDFTGRSREVAAAVEHLSYGAGLPVTVITGGPGIGKSSVAAAIAHELGARFPDGQLYAELGGVARPRDPQDVLAGMLETMGVAGSAMPTEGPARAALYRSMLAGRRVLVYADDASSAAQLRPLVPGVGGAALLITSRSALAGLPGAQTITLRGLPDNDALALLAKVAGQRPIADELPSAQAILAVCSGVPLALRLAGSILAARPGLAVSELADQLRSDTALDVLQIEDLSMRSAIAGSYDAVSSAAQRALLAAVAAHGTIIPASAFPDTQTASELSAVGLVTSIRADSPGEWLEINRLICRYLLHRHGLQSSRPPIGVQLSPNPKSNGIQRRYGPVIEGTDERSSENPAQPTPH